MNLVIAAAGTGGHIIPALNIALYLKKTASSPSQSHAIHWIGTPHGMENKIVPQHQLPMYAINFAGVRQKGIMRWFSLPFSLLKATRQALNILQTINPDAVLVMGGYVSAPTSIAAYIKGIPLIIHEQNAIPGLANRFCSLFAHRVCYAFPHSFKQQNSKYILTGNPINPQLGAKNPPNAQKSAPAQTNLNILILGGSLGAKKINTILPQALIKLQDKIDCSLDITHQCGKNNLAETQQHYQKSKLHKLNVQVIEFSESLYLLYQKADIIVARAGAMSVAEISVLGCPALFIPYPYAVNDHQYHNALSLVQDAKNSKRYGIIRDHLLDAEKVSHELHHLYNTSRQAELNDPKFIATNHLLAIDKIISTIESLIIKNR